MLFNSWSYVVFLALAVALHWALPQRLRIHLLAVMSLAFYACWRLDFVALMVFSACVDFVAARRIAAARGGTRARLWLWTSLSINVGLLVFFKYTYFLYDNAHVAGGLLGFELAPLQDLGLRIILPLGISFYTFQTISYTIDVFRGAIQPVRSFASFLTYVTFWPQLVAGPILRAGEVIPQLERPRRLRAGDASAGLLLVLSGLFKKVVIADHLAPIVDLAFAADAASLTVFNVWGAACLFGFQIYFDFSGYSDIAIGSARLCGIRFPRNFDWPYLARSPQEFWRRWHISLSAWIRDYLYLPLIRRRGGEESRGGIEVATTQGGRNAARFCVWFVMGLWHGASWTFAVWGLYHATVIYAYRSVPVLRTLPEKAPRVAWGLFFVVAMLGWIPFRAQSLGQTGALFSAFFDPTRYDFHDRLLRTEQHLIWLALLLGMLTLRTASHLTPRLSIPRPLAWAATCTAVALATALLTIFLEPTTQFLYFQF